MAVERLSAGGERLPERQGDSDSVPLSGGETGDDIDAFVTRLKKRWPQVATDIVDRLVGLYGSNAERMVEAMVADPVLARRCAADKAVTRGEVAYAVREEMAMTLQDFLERRARLFLWDVDNGLTVAPEAARLMGDLLGWDARRIDAELANYRRHVREVNTFSPELDAETTPRVAHG
jgi:glycerol-3-phosphate dehydrogenase